MRRANVQLQSDRRAEILAAAQRCFAQTGFHQTSMQEICAAAGMSPGNLYRYFPSKEAIIAGIAEQNRAEAAESFAAVLQAPDFFSGLAELARHYLIERDADEVGLCAEIMAESRRNTDVSRIYEAIERDVKSQIVEMLRQAEARGEIKSGLDLAGVATVLLTLGDGTSWRRAVDPSFNAETVLPLILTMVKCLLAPTTATEQKP
jgi:AcrR family transcriptional regulator